MPRTTKGNLAAKKHKAVLARTKGHYGARSRLFKTAKQSLIKSLQYAYRDRKNKSLQLAYRDRKKLAIQDKAAFEKVVKEEIWTAPKELMLKLETLDIPILSS